MRDPDLTTKGNLYLPLTKITIVNGAPADARSDADQTKSVAMVEKAFDAAPGLRPVGSHYDRVCGFEIGSVLAYF